MTNDVNDYSTLSATADGKTIVGIQSSGRFDVLAGDSSGSLRNVTSLSGSPVQASWYDSKHMAWTDVDGALQIVDANGEERRIVLKDRVLTTRISSCGDSRHLLLERLSGPGGICL